MLKIWCLLLCLNTVHAIPRNDVVIFGTTLGPNWQRPQSGDSKICLRDHPLDTSSHSNFIPGTIECPFSHPYILNGGLTCCRHMAHNDDMSSLLDYFDPDEKCSDSWPCPDPRRLCRKYDNLPSRKTGTLDHPYRTSAKFQAVGPLPPLSTYQYTVHPQNCAVL